MSKENPGVIFDASSSWNGYNHQGKLAIWIALRKIAELYDSTKNQEENSEMLSDYFLEIEYLEDFSLGKIENGNAKYSSVHQVKNHDKTTPSEYDSAFLGLVDHVTKMKDIKKAYLHTTKDVALGSMSVKEYVRNLADNPVELNKLLIEIDNVKSNGEKKAELICVRKGRYSGFKQKLVQTLIKSDSNQKFLTSENIDFACDLLVEEVNSQIRLLSKAKDTELGKIDLFNYVIEGNNQKYCPVDRIKNLILEEIKNLVVITNSKSYWTNADFINKRYLLLLGYFDMHIIDRNLNFPLYKDGTIDRKIKLSEIYQWLISEEIDNVGDEFYLFHIKEKFLEITNSFCGVCQEDGICTSCPVISCLNKIGGMSFKELKRFLYLTSPNVIKELSMSSFPEYASSHGIKNPFLTGVKGIKLPFEEEKCAITYTDMETMQYVLTTLMSDTEDDVPIICSDIIYNRSLYELSMDCDCFISRDIETESIFQSAIRINREYDKKESEHISRPKDAKIISLQTFRDTIDIE